MLRLWPETLHGGLFAGAAWLSTKGGRDMPERSPASVQADHLLAELEAMLAALPPASGRRRVLHLKVSDSLAKIAVLPWQQQLQAQAELQAYAQACFERNGMALDATSVMQVGFRHFGRSGLAYALPRAWLGAVVALCQQHQIQLQSVLPVSAAAYWRLPPTAMRLPGVVLLVEAQRVTALAHRADELSLIDVQPVTGDAVAASERLLRRLLAHQPSCSTVRYWSASASAAAPAVIREQLPEAEVLLLKREAWQ